MKFNFGSTTTATLLTWSFWVSTTMLSYARTWRDIQPLHGLYIHDATMRSQTFCASNPLFTPQPSSSPTVSQSPSASPSMAPSMVPSTMPSMAPSVAPSIADPYPVNPMPANPEPWYFNYDTSSNATHGPGTTVVTVDGSKVVNNHWGSVGNPPHNYWDEFGDHGYGPWNGLMKRFDMERNRCNTVGLQSPIDVRVNGAKCYETHQVRTQVSTLCSVSGLCLCLMFAHIVSVIVMPIIRWVIIP
jgi:phage terminase large subunit-like protein